MENILIKNAYENNLKHIDLKIPLNSFTCVTGCSGCGKSSLVFDTIYAESQRAFLEGMSGNLYGQKLMDKPKVESIQNLRPALNISQNYYNVNPRSSVGTITEISYYLRALFSLVNGNGKISENYFSANNPKSFCPNCNGLGTENVISESLLIPDKEKRLCDGAILFFKGSEHSKEYNCLNALCQYYNIDINKKVSELTKEELDKLLYSTEKIKYKVSYKVGKKHKQHYVFLQGAVSMIQEKLSYIDASPSNAMYSCYMEEVPCHVCRGTKFLPKVLEYTVAGKNINQVENIEFFKMGDFISEVKKTYSKSDKKELVNQLSESIDKRLKALLLLNLGYLTSSRSIPSLSGGERQRIRIASQLNCSLKDLIYILDEPCKGLHYRDVNHIIEATKKLVSSGNTVIAIEHNNAYISQSDKVIELGPEGGPKGGYLINEDAAPSNYKVTLNFKEPRDFSEFVELKNISFRNIRRQSAKFPIGGITCVTGVSGSGKTSFVSVVKECVEKESNIYCESFIDNGIHKVYAVNQNPIGKTPRSTIASYLEIYDLIRNVFAKTQDAKNRGLGASNFSINVKAGRCECCQGTGMQKLDLNYLPESYILCPECKGKRFEERILQVKYKEKNISQILDTPVEEITSLFSDILPIYEKLEYMNELGLGYLSLGRMSMNLSGGEAQRIKLAKALGTKTTKSNLYILDEPTSGLNSVDIQKFQKILKKLQANGETILIIEHNLEFITSIADYVIDFGKFGGEKGGKIASQGLLEKVVKNKESSWFGLKI